MAHTRFIRDFDLRRKSFTIAYLAGMELNIPVAYQREAVRAGAAICLVKKTKDGPFEEVADGEER